MAPTPRGLRANTSREPCKMHAPAPLGSITRTAGRPCAALVTPSLRLPATTRATQKHAGVRVVSQSSSRASRLTVNAVSAPSSPASSNDTADAKRLETYKILVYSADQYVQDFMGSIKDTFPSVKFVEQRLCKETAKRAKGYDAVCLFVNDDCGAEVVDALADVGVRCIAMRCAGFDRVDLETCEKRGVTVVRVPTYSPASIAEMALALLMTIARKLQLAIPRAREGNYTVSGLVGWELASCNFGIVGTGAIGAVMAKLALGFQKHTGQKPTVYCYDLYPRQDLIDAGVKYVDLETLLRESHVVSLHCPLLPSTFHIIDEERIKLMRDDVLLVNVSRGGLIDTRALLDALYEGKFGGVAMDVYEKEGNLFFTDYTKYATADRIKNWDREFAQLKVLPNVVVTPHIAFMTNEALSEICKVTTDNLKAVCLGAEVSNAVKKQPNPK